jgi:hypothetical protein
MFHSNIDEDMTLINRKVLIACAIACFGLSSCNDILDINDTTKLSDQAIWSTESAAEMYITAAYKIFTDYSNIAVTSSAFYDSYSDMTKSTSWDLYNHGYNKALLLGSAFSTGSAGSLDCWDNCYTRIRRANVLLDEIGRYGESKYGEDWCNIRRAEVRFCRAYAYFHLALVYGGVVIRTDETGVNGVDDGSYEEDINRARATEAETYQFILDELQWAANYLPEKWTTDWTGRATKAAAYGMISRVALYAKQWQVAINAAEKVKELGAYLVSDYAKLFQSDSGQDNSPEVLFGIHYLKGSVTHTYDSRMRPFYDQTVYSAATYAEHVPTAELADLYEFSDGTEFNWKTWSANHSDPYTDREPRFQATILYNGCDWGGRTIQTYVGGTDGFIAYTQSGSTNGHTCTGYYVRKYLQENNTSFGTDHSWQTDNVLRYAEVLLNKAEAYAELDFAANKEKALDALNEVRSRVNLPGRTSEQASSKDAFMTLLRKERCVELACEGFRYWDLRRWRLAESVINGQNAHGTKITKNDDGTFNYEQVECDGGSARIFLERYYYLSLPTAETANNKLCENNPYW